MRFRVINIVDSFAKVNFGIWNAAVNTAPLLAQNHELVTELWYPAQTQDHDIELMAEIIERPLPETSLKQLRLLVKEAGLQPATDIIVTHGAWRYPTRWGAWLRSQGFKWVYTPHGMLEPWSMNQKALLKSFYFTSIEGPKSRKASGVRAVGKPERENLLEHYKRVVFIPNGHSPKPSNFARPQEPIQFVYLARFHPKKRPLQLVQAWLASPLSQDIGFRLVMAGPDEENTRAGLEKLITDAGCTSLVVQDPVYGAEKVKLLRQSHFFILPSLSEGFPTSVIEAMSEGLIPLLSQGCNFPDVFEHKLALDSGTHPPTIQKAIEEAASIAPARRAEWQNRCLKYALANYSLEVVARHQAFWYGTLLGLTMLPKKEQDLDNLPEIQDTFDLQTADPETADPQTTDAETTDQETSIPKDLTP